MTQVIKAPFFIPTLILSNTIRNAPRQLVWRSRPSISPLVVIYGIVSMIVLLILVTLEYVAGSNSTTLLPASIDAGGTIIYYPVELATAIVIILIFIAKALGLFLLRARSRYELYDDGLYVNLGILNLESTFVSPMAFSDARLIRTVSLRIVQRGNIIVDSNDGRHFYLKLIKDPLTVQSLIRTTLGRPRVRTD